LSGGRKRRRRVQQRQIHADLARSALDQRGGAGLPRVRDRDGWCGCGAVWQWLWAPRTAPAAGEPAETHRAAFVGLAGPVRVLVASIWSEHRHGAPQHHVSGGGQPDSSWCRVNTGVFAKRFQCAICQGHRGLRVAQRCRGPRSVCRARPPRGRRAARPARPSWKSMTSTHTSYVQLSLDAWPAGSYCWRHDSTPAPPWSPAPTRASASPWSRGSPPVSAADDLVRLTGRNVRTGRGRRRTRRRSGQPRRGPRA